MGYTVYWTTRQAYPDDKVDAFLGHVKAALRHPDMPQVVFEHDEPKKRPVVNKKEIRFNGPGDSGHETFILVLDGADHAFCKTARKPYSAMVFIVLMLANHFATGWCKWDDDGDCEDKALARKVLRELVRAGESVTSSESIGGYWAW